MVVIVVFDHCCVVAVVVVVVVFFFFQAEDGIRGLVRSRGLGDVYKRQVLPCGGLEGPGPGGVWGRSPPK